jgi:hypothetical protein
MIDLVTIPNIQAVFERERELPTIVLWNRLEGRPRRKDFSRALKAEVRDALWMLCRQWQTGEFDGDDAGSPIAAKLRYATDRVTHVRSGGGRVSDYDNATPLETIAEQIAVPLTQGNRPFAYDQRLALGRHWSKLLTAKGHQALIPDFRERYKFVAPNADDPADFSVTAHAAAFQSIAAMAGRVIDGGALYLHLVTAGHAASDGLALSGVQKSDIDTLGGEFRKWADRLYQQPKSDTDSSWLPNRLEYSFALAAPKGDAARTLVADEYHGGALDWYSFDVAAAPHPDFPPPVPGQEQRVVTSFIPTGIRFEGMPNTRWWTFEEGATNFGNVRPDTTDLSKLLLVEFGLVYSNDWFLLPVALDVGSITRVEGLAVTNVFGERFWIAPASSGPEEAWRKWGMFNISSRSGGAVDTSLLLLATTPETMSSRPVETVDLVRDEVSNMVWGIETTVQLADGSSRRGREVALELHARHQAALDAQIAAAGTSSTPPSNNATIRYELMSSVPENWIPFAPIHIENDNREIQLQRSAMPRMLKGGTAGAPVPPRTFLMREGYDQGRRYIIAEEEIGRAGERLQRKWQRTRWNNGRAFVWLSVERRTGRGEGSSGLSFDQMRPKPGTGSEEQD